MSAHDDASSDERDDDIWLEIVAPKVLELHANMQFDGEESATWTVEYDPEPDRDNGTRFIVCTLEVSVPDAIVRVTVGATAIGDTFGTVTGNSHDAYAELLTDAMSLDMVADLAMITARGLLGTLGDGSQLPGRPLEPVIERMELGQDGGN